MSTPADVSEAAATHEVKIGDWTLDPERNELRRDGRSQRLEPKVIEVLAYLARRQGRVIAREELLAAVWPGVIVGDDVLTQAIIKLRKALGDDAHKPTYIETISKRGYRLIAPVETMPPAAGTAPSAQIARSALRTRQGMLKAAFIALAVVIGAAIAIPLIRGSIRMPWPLGVDTHGAVSASMPIVAILPLANLSGDPQREYFSDGVTEDLIGALGRFSGVRVMSRNAVQGFKGKSPTPQAIRDELGATYIVQGSVREAEGKMRITVALSDTQKGLLIWSEHYDASGVQLFEIQDRIARSVVGTLHVKLTEVERQRTFTKPTESLEAYDLVLRARSLMDPPERRTNREARALLVQAQKLAPDYAEASTALGEAELDRARFGWVADAPETMSRAEELGKRALDSADTRSHPRAHSLLAAINGYQRRYDEALTHTQRAIELNPSDSAAQYRHGEALVRLGRIEDAIAPLEIAKRLEPRAVRIYLAMAYYLSGRYDDTVTLADSLLGRRPDHVALNAIRAAALAQLGKMEEARDAADRVRRHSPTFQVEIWMSGLARPEHAAKVQEGLRKAGL